MDGQLKEPIVDRERLIVIELKKLQGIAEKQERFRKELTSRLVPVARAQQSTASEDAGMPSTGVPLADDLAVVARQLDKTNETLEDILERLEI